MNYFFCEELGEGFCLHPVPKLIPMAPTYVVTVYHSKRRKHIEKFLTFKGHFAKRWDIGIVLSIAGTNLYSEIKWIKKCAEEKANEIVAKANISENSISMAILFTLCVVHYPRIGYELIEKFREITMNTKQNTRS